MTPKTERPGRTLTLQANTPGAQTDPLHPNGRCTCAGEGSCEWCSKTEKTIAAMSDDERLYMHEGAPALLKLIASLRAQVADLQAKLEDAGNEYSHVIHLKQKVASLEHYIKSSRPLADGERLELEELRETSAHKDRAYEQLRDRYAHLSYRWQNAVHHHSRLHPDCTP